MTNRRRTPADARAQLAPALTGCIVIEHDRRTHSLSPENLPYVQALRAELWAWIERLNTEEARLLKLKAEADEAEDDAEATDIVYCHDDDNRIEPCQYGHPNCATVDRGRCSDEDWHQVRADLRRKREAAAEADAPATPADMQRRQATAAETARYRAETADRRREQRDDPYWR